VIKNGKLESFDKGIVANGREYVGLRYPDDVLIENVVIQEARYTGIEITGRGMVVRNNRIMGIGTASTPGWRYGISVRGPHNRILDNEVTDMELTTDPAGSQAIYIFLSDAAGSIVEGNRLTDRNGDQPGQGIAVGGTSPTGDDVLVVNNRLSGMRYGIYYYSGLTGKYRDNLTSGVPNPFLGGTDAGNNR
jgi:hypothetical protein